MKAVIQRVSRAKVSVEGRITGEIEKGILIFLGVGKDDTGDDLDLLIKKVPSFRMFSDADGKMNLSVLDIGGSVLVVSQFTLFGSWRKGNRPGFTDAAAPEKGERMYNSFVKGLKEKGINVETGVFGAMMNVDLVNDGPVTFILDTKNPV